MFEISLSFVILEVKYYYRSFILVIRNNFMIQGQEIITEETNDQLKKQDQDKKSEVGQFSNPVCKQTYQALPRIYGKKKKVANKNSTKNQAKFASCTAIENKTKAYFSSPENRVNSTSMSKKQRMDKTVKLSSPKHPSLCSRQNCSCHIEQQALRKMKEKKLSSTFVHLRLPSIQKFQLEDLQSMHKVSTQPIATNQTNTKSGLQIIIQQQNEMAMSHIKKSQSKQKKSNKRLQANYSNLYKMHISGMKKIKNNRHKFKPKINSTSIDLQDTSQQQSQIQNKSNAFHSQTEIKKFTARYKTQQLQSPKSKSVMIDSTIFKTTRKQNTNFACLNESEKSLLLNKLGKRRASILPNGKFRIPEQPQYALYLKEYIVMNKQFNLEQLVRSEKFKIQRGDNWVYFGQFQADRKSGKGIYISQKQIFQGNFYNNIKVNGYQRNIDGVFIGEFKNGLRSGTGIFHWNNGEIFQGNWINGMKNGYGVWKSPKGDKYEGQWMHNRQHGTGQFFHHSSTYKGQFKNFLKDGQGEEIFSNGDVYKGQYKQGKPNGKGRYQWKDGSFYQGQFLRGMREGQGIWVDSAQTKYQGSFQSDFKHGYGIQTYASGQRFQGKFNEGKRMVGRLYSKNNKCIQIKQK